MSLTMTQKMGLKYLASEIPALMAKVHKNTIYSLRRRGLIDRRRKLTKKADNEYW